MFWIIGGFTILAAWAVLSVVGGERERLLQEMRTELAAASAVTAIPAPAAPAAKTTAKPANKPAAKAVRPNRPAGAAPATAAATSGKKK